MKEDKSEVLKIGATNKQQDRINYAWEISGGDKDFILTLNAENGNWDEKRQSNIIDKNGRREPSFGFCQIHKGYHPKIVNNPKFFIDWKWQLDTCLRLYQGGTTMYGYNVRNSNISQFIF